MKIVCGHCGKSALKEASAVNRAARAGLNIYCTRKCAGLARRKHKTAKQLIEDKRLYDIEYRRKNKALLKAKKARYFKRTYDPTLAAIERKKRMPKHVEYCRRPEYRIKKSAYDKKHLAAKNYGPFAEVAMLTNDLNREIKERMTNAEIKWENQTSNKAQFRDREGKEKRYRCRRSQTTVS